MSDARLQRHTIRYKQFISAAEECQRSSKTGYGRSGKPAMADPPDYRGGYRAARPSNGPSRPIVAQACRQVYGARRISHRLLTVLTESIRRRGDARAAANPLAGGAHGAAPS